MARPYITEMFLRLNPPHTLEENVLNQQKPSIGNFLYQTVLKDDVGIFYSLGKSAKLSKIQLVLICITMCFCQKKCVFYFSMCSVKRNLSSYLFTAVLKLDTDSRVNISVFSILYFCHMSEFLTLLLLV